MIQFIHSYMQFGCLASELIIQVSDHPVAPSLGRKPWLAGLASTGTPSSFSAKYWYCQVVPTVDVAAGEGGDLLGGFRPVFADVLALFLEQVRSPRSNCSSFSS